MYGVIRTRQFERSGRTLKKSGLFGGNVQNDLRRTIDLLVGDEPLPASYVDHQLKGELRSYRECHIKGDLLLIYAKHKGDLILVLVDIGSHSYLFG